MNPQKAIKQLCVTATIFMLTAAGWAQSAYFTAITNLNPVAYWPMHEVEAPVQGDIETNYGTLGLLGTGYYPDWANVNGNVIQRQAAGALTNDTDAAVYFAYTGGNNTGGTTNALFVPHTSPLSTLNPPFTVECWFNATSGHSGQYVWSQCGYEGLNAGSSGKGQGNVCGIQLYVGPAQSSVQFYGNSGNTIHGFNQNILYDQWNHFVVTCDANTNLTVYINGSLAGSPYAAAGLYVPDYWTPFEVGNGRGNQRAFEGSIDEVAVYTNVITDIDTHYTDGVSGAAGAYFHDVTNDHPVIYLRMDGLAYTAPDVSTWPVLTNYGSAAANGVYTPGTMPGIVSGPADPNGVPYGGFSGEPVAQLSGVSSFADAGYAAAYDPTGPTPFTVTALFRGNPCDNRYEDIVSHSDNSWRIAMNTNGKLFCGLGTNQTGHLNSTRVYNDGNWHQAVWVYAPAADPNAPGTSALYVDGVLDTSVSTVSTNGMGPGSPLNVMIGGAPDYTNNPAGLGRQFSGQVCDVAFFDYAFTAGDVATLYNGSGVAPFIVSQPVSATVNGNVAFTNTVVANGSGPLSYQWYKNNLPLPLAGQTNLLNGGTNAELVIDPVKASDDSTNYYVVVSNSQGSITSAVVSLTVNSSPEFVTELPATYTNQFTLFAGASLNFSVLAVGSQPISYQWYDGGVAVDGATNTDFAKPNLSIGSVTTYCVASNFVGSVTSVVWSASVIADPVAPYPQQVLAAKPVGYWRLNEPDSGVLGNAGVVALDYMGGNNAVYTNVNLGEAGYSPATDPTETSVLFGETGISFIDSYAGEIQGVDFAAPDGSSSDFTIEAWVNGGAQTINGAGLVTKGYGNGGEQFDLDVYQNHYRFFVRDASGTTHAYTSTVGLDGYWHHVVGVCDQTGGKVALYLDGQLLGTSAITPGTGILTSTNVTTIGARRSGIGTNDYDFQYYGSIDDVAVYNYALSAQQILDQYTAAGVAPIPTELPPTAVTVDEGSTLTLPVQAVGTPPLTNTWFDTFNFTNVAQTVVTGTNFIDGTLVVSNVPVDWDFDTLQLTVANAYGSTNVNVTLAVLSGPPVIVRDLPMTVRVLNGSSYTYTVGVQGSRPLSYQWYSNNVVAAGQTASSYTVNSSSNQYSVIVTNVYGAATSRVSTVTGYAPITNAYAASVSQLNPVAYWPMHEEEAPAPGDIETNYGTLGLLGTGYYPDWAVDSGAFIRGWPGALAGDTNPAVHFTKLISSGKGAGTWTNELYVPHTSPLTTLNPPFSVECWFYPTNAGGGSQAQSIWGQHGFEALNAGYAGSGDGAYQGIQLGYNGTFTVFFYSDGTQYLTPSSPTYPTNQWYHLVVTCDANTNITLYINGVVGTASSAAGRYLPDYWTPLTIGGTRGGTRSTPGSIDEFAVYTNVITDIAQHYSDGTNPAPATSYYHDVTNDNPIIYFRMDAPPYTPSTNPWPVLFNYGSVGVAGVYTPGTMPGIVPGPVNLNGVPYIGLGSDTNVAQLSGVSSFADAGYAAAYDPVGPVPFSIMAVFRGNPCDNRVESIVGHSDNSWRIVMNTDGRLQCQLGTDAGSVVNSAGIYNDGNWHQVVAVYTPASDPNATGTNALYVDGVLDNAVSAVSAQGIGPGSPLDVMIGAAPDYTNNPAGVGRQFAGQICEVALFTNALTVTQVQQLYDATVPPLVNLTPTNLVFSVAGGQLTLSWPPDYIGWTLQAQTNSLGTGLSTNWSDVSGSAATNQVTVPINPNNGSVFYRLIYP